MLIYGLSDISNSLGLSLDVSSMGKSSRTWCIIIVKKKEDSIKSHFEDYEVPEHAHTKKTKQNKL